MKSTLVRISLGLSLLLCMPVGRFAQGKKNDSARYTVTDIGTLGGANSFAYALNGSGSVAGGANIPGQNDLIKQTGFVWYGGLPISVGTLGGPACGANCSSQAAAVSANGTVAVLSETAYFDPNGEDFCEFGTGRQCLAAVWRNGTLTALPPLPGGNNSEAFFVNNGGEIVGTSEIGKTDPTCAPPQVHLFEAVKWSHGTPTPLPPLPTDTVSFAFTNNEAGEAVGFSGLCANVTLPPFLPPSAPHAVMWDTRGTPHNLGNPDGGAGDNVAGAINNHSQVTMNSLMLDGTIHAFLWTAGVLRDLGTYPGDAFITVVPCCNTINDRGQIVGFSVDSTFNQTALLWESAGQSPIDLNSLLPVGSPWYVQSPAGINEAGEIAATAVNLDTHETHAVMLSPIRGVGPAARGAAKPPAIPVSVQRAFRRKHRF